MCCFSKAVQKVADTNIFARSSKDGKQFLVYSMALTAKEDLAMILPIPVPKKSKENAVRWINLEKYEDFFKDMHKGFPAKHDGRGLGGGNSKGPKPGGVLKVEKVGKFEASFVPSVKDFSRLDERFRLPAGVWDKLPDYKDYGFAVFKLSDLKKGGLTGIHPMAFEFPRAKPKQLFFPTVHIHDGKVHDRASFDHALYCQLTNQEELPMKWEESPQPASFFLKADKCQGMVEKDMHVYQLRLKGKLKNKDTWL
jgi:hypothetical protein